MANFIQATIVGRVGQDVKLKTAGNTQVATFSVAVNETFGAQENKQTITTWINVEAWDALATIAQTILRKSVTVFIQGKIRSDNYEKDNLKVRGFKISAETIQVFDPKPQQEEEGQ